MKQVGPWTVKRSSPATTLHWLETKVTENTLPLELSWFAVIVQAPVSCVPEELLLPQATENVVKMPISTSLLIPFTPSDGFSAGKSARRRRSSAFR